MAIGRVVGVNIPLSSVAGSSSMESTSGSSIMALRSVDGSAIESPEGFPLAAILAAPGGAGV